MPLIDTLLDWDAAALAWLAAHHHPAADAALLAVSVIGRWGAVWLAIAAALVLRDRRRLSGALTVVLALALAHTATDLVLKPLIARARPFESEVAVRVLDRSTTTYSFPSGHAATAFAGAASLARVWPPGRAMVWGLAAAMAFSRVYLGVHYPLDVIAGALVGVLCARLAWRLRPPPSAGPASGPRRHA